MRSIRRRPPQRDPSQTVVSFSCPKALRARIEHAAAREKRKLTEWLCLHLPAWLDEFEKNPVAHILRAMPDAQLTAVSSSSRADEPRHIMDDHYAAVQKSAGPRAQPPL